MFCSECQVNVKGRLACRPSWSSTIWSGTPKEADPAACRRSRPLQRPGAATPGAVGGDRHGKPDVRLAGGSPGQPGQAGPALQPEPQLLALHGDQAVPDLGHDRGVSRGDRAARRLEADDLMRAPVAVARVVDPALGDRALDMPER